MEPNMLATKKSKPRLPAFARSPISADARWCTINDVAETRRISRFQIYKLINEGSVKARKLGSRTLIDLQSLDAYLDALPPAQAANGHEPPTAA
jgi:excisionase family DNA binding protein